MQARSPRRQSCLLVLASLSSAGASKFSDIGGTSRVTRSLVSSLTAAVNALGGSTASAAPRQRQLETISGDEVLAGLRADFEDREYLWSGKITPELYDEDCVFTDPTLSFSGLATFEKNLENLDPWINRFVPEAARSVELRRIALTDDGRAVEAEWRMLGNLALPWRPRLDLEGRTTYTLEGEGGRISAYNEAWAITPAEALWMLVRPYGGE